MNQAELTPQEALRRFLRSGQEDAPRVLPGLLAKAAGAVAGATGPHGAAAAGQCVFLLGALLRTQRDTALAARLLQTLTTAGRLGRALVGLHLQSRPMPLPQCTALLLVLPDQDFLALVNELLLDCPAYDKQFALWLKTLLPAPGRLDPREALLFLKTLAAPPLSGEDAPLARPLRDALLAGRLGETIAHAFAGSPGATTLEALHLAARVLAVPELQQEALAHALRTAGAEGPSRLGPLLDGPREVEPRETALILEMRRLALQPHAPAALYPAAQSEPRLLGLVLADLLADGGRHAAAAMQLLPLLPLPGLQACLQALPGEAHAAVHARLLQALAHLDPEFLRRAGKALAPGLNLDKAAVQALAELLAPRPAEDALAPWKTGTEPEAAPQAKVPTQRRTALAEAVDGALAPIRDRDFAQSELADTVLEGLQFNTVDLTGSSFSGVTFHRVRLNAALLSQCAFDTCRFLACTFTGADLSASRFRACRFESCGFDFTDLSRAQFTGCLLSGCTFTECSLAGAALAETRLETTGLRTCTLAGSLLSRCTLRNLGLARSDLCASLWLACSCRNAELTSCSLAAMRLEDCECLELSLARCISTDLTVLGGHTDNPILGQAKRAARFLRSCRLPQADRTGGGSAALKTGGGAAFAKACVEAFLRVNQARQSLTAMRHRDQRRRQLALERLGESQAQFLRFLPVLLGTDLFERALGLQDIPVCALAGHARLGGLCREAAPFLERHIPGLPPCGEEGDQAQTPVLTLEAVYLMGSLGSVAQKPDSDLDCWVCVRPLQGAGPETLPDLRAALARKLNALERWAAQQFGLETHFFLMTLDEVRRNDFGVGDRESSGTAQATLLKEEFYRTALKLAGKDLLWWAAPTGAGQAEARALLDELAVLAPRTAAELTDLGQPQPIPAEEYFGACLWQIVKALHSPYKSVMKLGLLEKYAGQDPESRLLCDRIKAAALRGSTRLRDVDPYLSLFTAIHGHYEARGDGASLALVAECLRLKALVEPEDLPGGFAWPGPSADPETGGKSFAKALRLGGMVNSFMVSAYRRIQEGLRADASAAQISPEDLTRLGRRIAANFAQRQNKVELVPFLSEETVFAELYFYAEKALGKRAVWAVKGKDRGAGKVAVESLAAIRRDTDVVRLLAWLLFNGLYDTRQVVQAERSLAPIALTDLQNLLADMAAFFPRRATLEPDLDEYLKVERVVRAYLIANLPVPLDKNNIHTVSVLFATNWGEVFCQTFDNPPLTLQQSARGFLGEALGRPVPPDTEIKVFIPKKSACPRIRLG